MGLTSSHDSGFGSSITFASGLLAKIIEINGEALQERKVVEYIHFALTNGAIDKQPSDVHNPGRFRVRIYFESHSLALYRTAMRSATETVTVTLPIPSGGSSAGSLSGTGFATGMSLAVASEEGMTSELTLECAGNWTWTAAA